MKNIAPSYYKVLLFTALYSIAVTKEIEKLKNANNKLQEKLSSLEAKSKSSTRRLHF